MEERKIVGERDGPRPREVLMNHGEVEVLFGGQEMLAPMPDGEYMGDD
jgi:S-DNA-T family DNA segregation ATPase FtsK/SpoIIIE